MFGWLSGSGLVVLGRRDECYHDCRIRIPKYRERLETFCWKFQKADVEYQMSNVEC